MARRGQRPSGATRTQPRTPARGQRNQGRQSRGGRRLRELDNEGIIPVLARAVREVENEVQRGPVSPSGRTKFQVVALLVREERTRVKADTETPEAQRAEQLKRLDGIATILAKTTARDPTLFALLAEDARVSEAALMLKERMQTQAGLPAAEPDAAEDPEVADAGEDGAPATERRERKVERRVVPQSVIARQLANPFLVPDFSGAPPRTDGPRRLATWELIGPLLSSFERAASGAVACMPLPEPTSLNAAGGKILMHHQAQVVESARAGHRTFLLADEPGLGKTAQSLLAAQAADAYPLLVVVPNVVKTNWAREAELWTPRHRATVVTGDGLDVDGFADIVVVNYEILDRHVGWLGDHGFRAMVVDEAHFIKNKTSQRSQHVLQLAERIRRRTARPLLMALTGTPLINDIEDFRAIWQFLGWTDDKRPEPLLMSRLEDIGLTPADPPFYPAARHAVIDLGIVRRRKVDVAADIPARRIADLPVELDGALGRSIREAERTLARRMVKRYQSALETRTSGRVVEGIDHQLVRQVAGWERSDSESTGGGENVFSMLRRIGQAKAELAADYAAQLVNSVGKVVFFAKHVDVLDEAEALFAKRGLQFSSIRGDQTAKVRQRNIDAFTDDPDVQVAVCSLMAAGVGLNLQVASNVVLAELSWTDAEQTQAIDRVHRIGQAEPVTAWRIIASQTVDTRIAELIDAKAGLAARALDGSDAEVGSSADLQLEALVGMLTDALTHELGGL